MTAHAIEARPVYTLETPDRADLLLHGFLAGYSGHTAAAVRGDLKHYLGWLMGQERPVSVLAIERPHLELYLQHLRTWVSPKTHRKLRPATRARMFGTVKLLYAYAHQEDFIAKDPSARIKRPSVPDDEQGREFLTPLEYAALLQEARKRPMDHALVALLGMMGLRISEATQLDIDRNLGIENGYEVIRFIGKGAKPATMPLPAPVVRAVHTVIGDRTEGPLLTTRAGTRMDQKCAARTLERLARSVGLTKHISPHCLRRTFVTSGLLSGVPLRDVQVAARHADPGMTVRYDRMANGLDRHAAHRISGFLAGMAR